MASSMALRERFRIQERDQAERLAGSLRARALHRFVRIVRGGGHLQVVVVDEDERHVDVPVERERRRS